MAYPRLSALVDHGQQTSGNISALNCHNHGSVVYEFVVNGQRYSGDSNRGFRGLCGPRLIGQPVTVYYLPEEPVKNEWSATIILAGVLPHEGMLPVDRLSFRLLLYLFNSMVEGNSVRQIRWVSA